MLRIKKSSKINGLRPEMVLATIVVNEAYAIWGYDCVITEGTGSKHGSGSLHYVGLAEDYRMNDVDKIDREKIVYDIKDRLSDQFDVVLEEYHGNPINDHLHIEFQPK